ncbi:YebC/PmpR family DNA-binding transcriptional regulator [Candidatus Falkowbacteria bacterium]|jgi:YebC/PmpR family DNA-binding regulatory protein|nr:YebC/PmpR family DNA-binding transcriptional regulator [Candidatus Falkowbacteria bacterium]MBT7007029.1 YebC/PmpR family DNA-binding transcriptional regulator [Candidatus Falkowbacteria bacterium]
MSGHSKWDKIHRQKGVADAKRGSLFTKHSKNITIAAKNGGDPTMNFSLRLAVEKAKLDNMPKDNIEKAIKKGTGEIEGVNYEDVMYEGYAPGGVPILIVGITDNKNRTTPEVKAILSKNGGSLGAQNSVAWMFEHKGVIHIANADEQDELMLELLDAGAEDVLEEDGLTVYTTFENFEKVKKFLETKKIETDYSEIDWVAKDKQDVDESRADSVQKIIDALEDHDDINNVYSNVE